MRLVWDENAWEDYLWWQAQDRTTLRRINALIRDILRHGNEGLGKPEPVADAIAFLVSEQSRWITGQEIVVDGGRSINFSHT